MFLPADEYLALPREPQPWVVDKLVPVGGLVNVFGKPKTGKSFVALGMAEAIVTGQPDWEGFAIKKHGPVAYLQVDTPREEWATRVERIQKATGPDKLWIADMWMVPEFPFNILNPQNTEVQWLKDHLARIKPVMVIIDTLREIHAGDEDSSTTMRNVIANLVGACRPAAIVLVSHSRKDSVMTQTGVDDLMDQQRGSSYISGRMDVIAKVTAKRLTFKGRATGQMTYPIHQDERGFIHVERDGEDAFEDARKIVADKYVGKSINVQAEHIARLAGISHSTAYRKLRDWTAKHEQLSD
jgi:RecA-family ATPase